jgi:ABC-type uncharacterized transport system permease subunit
MISGIALGPGALALVHSVFSALPILVFIGLLAGFVGVHFSTAMQATTPSHLRGRVFGIIQLMAGVYPLAMGLADLSGQNIPLIYAASSIMLLMVSFSLTGYAPFRAFCAYEASS